MPDVVATVNGVPIDQKALGAAMQALALEQFHCTVAEIPEGAHDELKEMAMERLIARELIFQAALAEGFIASQEDVDAETSRILRLSGQPKDFWSRLAERGMDQVAFERMVRQDVTVNQLTARKIDNIADPDEQTIEKFFREDPRRLQKPQRVQLQHILFPVDPENPGQAFERAKAVKSESEKNDFRALAQKYSACPSAPGGGDLGFVRHEDVDPALADVIFKLPIDTVSGPFKTPLGVHLVKVVARDNPGPPTLEEARPAIIEVLKRVESARILSDWVADLRHKADVIIQV